MAYVGDLITAQSREGLRSAVIDKSYELAKRLGLTNQEASVIATQILQVVEHTEVTPHDLTCRVPDSSL